MLAPGTVLQDRYRIVRQLGQGGMGRVYEAFDDRLQTTVALKQTHSVEAEFRKAFEREARILAKLRHNALPKVIDHFGNDSNEFLVMEFITGKDLKQLLDERKAPLPFDQVLVWSAEILDALEYLHSQLPPIIHRDIKPQNLKLTDYGTIVLLDFGLAKSYSLEASQSIHGYTAAYAPIEQIQGNQTDRRSDIFSFGATLYRLMTRQLPVSAEVRNEVVKQGVSDPLRAPYLINPQIPISISLVLEKAMALKPEDRYPTISDLRQAIQNTNQMGRSFYQSRKSIISIPPPSDVPLPQVKGKSSWEKLKEFINSLFSRKVDLFLPQPETQDKDQEKTTELPVQPKLVLPTSTNLIEEHSPIFERKPVSIQPIQESKSPQLQDNEESSLSAFFKNKLGMEFVLIPSGRFLMGSNNGFSNEKPIHEVKIIQPFYLGKFQVTQVQWQKVMGTNPATIKGETLPVETVSWNDCQDFIKKLNSFKDGYCYRLPSEAEWEYACRAGTISEYAGDLDAVAWHKANSGGVLHPVGQKSPNDWGSLTCMGMSGSGVKIVIVMTIHLYRLTELPGSG